MITRIRIRNFKALDDVEFDLGISPIVLVGPNNSGKSSILQALTMWNIGLREWKAHLPAHRMENGKLRGVGITLDSFPALVTPDFRMLWKETKVREGAKKDVLIYVDVLGEQDGTPWKIGAEFTYRGHLMTYCRPAPDNTTNWAELLPKVGFLQPISGLADFEEMLLPSSIRNRLGSGKTADVLRNVCHQLLYPDNGDANAAKRGPRRWEDLQKCMREMYFVDIRKPVPDQNKGRILLRYKDDGNVYDLSSAGRGFHQTLLLLAYLYSNPNSIVLLDEPDAHLELVRQSEIFAQLCTVAHKQGTQLIVASHSERILNEAAQSGDIVTVLAGKANNMTRGKESKDREIEAGRYSQILIQIGWEKFYLAEKNRHVIYVEGITDKHMLIAYAEKLHAPQDVARLKRANFQYLGGPNYRNAIKTFKSLKQAVPDLNGYILVDRIRSESSWPENGLRLHAWSRREIENYLPLPEVLKRYALDFFPEPSLSEDTHEEHSAALFSNAGELMEEAITENTAPRALADAMDQFWHDSRSSEYMQLVLDTFFSKMGIRNQLPKNRYHTLVKLVAKKEIPDEARKVVDDVMAIVK